MSKKQSVLLGLREKLEKSFQLMLDDMTSKFKNKQGLFMGERKTYTAIEGFADEPTKRSYTNVASTVKEQLEWFKKHTADYLKTTLSIEKTNATGLKAELIVAGTSWGEYSTLELLRMKSVLDSKLRQMIDELPIRQETQIWKPTTDANYAGREVYESPIDGGFSKTTLKETIIVLDPHADKPGRQPVSANIDRQVNVGEYTIQNFSGAITNLERANLKVRYNELYTAVIEALEKANNADSVESDLGDKMLEHLF